MSCICQQLARFLQILRFHQQVIAIESRNHEYPYVVGRYRFDHRENDARLIKGERTLKFETVPAGIGLNIIRDSLLAADDGKLVIGPADAEKTCAIGQAGMDASAWSRATP